MAATAAAHPRRIRSAASPPPQCGHRQRMLAGSGSSAVIALNLRAHGRRPAALGATQRPASNTEMAGAVPGDRVDHHRPRRGSESRAIDPGLCGRETVSGRARDGARTVASVNADSSRTETAGDAAVCMDVQSPTDPRKNATPRRPTTVNAPILPLLPEVQVGPQHADLLRLDLASQGVHRHVWHGAYGAMLIEVHDGAAFVNGARVASWPSCAPPWLEHAP